MKTDSCNSPAHVKLVAGVGEASSAGISDRAHLGLDLIKTCSIWFMQEVQFIIQLSLLSSAVFHFCGLTYTSEVKFSSAYVCWLVAWFVSIITQTLQKRFPGKLEYRIVPGPEKTQLSWWGSG